MKLYTYDPAPNPRRLQLFLDYKGIEIESVQVDLLNKEQFGEEYRRINPAATVPALLLDDGTLLTEVIGTCVYLEAMYPEKPLLGTTPLEKALVISEDHALYNTAFMAVAEAFRNSAKGFQGQALPGPLGLDQIPALVERGRKRLDFHWRELDQRLATRRWLVGDDITLADIDLLVCCEFAGWIKATPGEEFIHLIAYLERVREALA